MARVLVVDDRPENRQSMAALLKSAGHDVQSAAEVLEAAARLRVSGTDVVLSDIRLEAERDGLRLLRIVKSELPHVPVILYTAFPTIRDVVDAMKLGADDYLELPTDPDQILQSIATAVERRRYPWIPVDARGFVPLYPHNIVAVSAPMRAVLDWAARIGPKDLTVLLEGETGTGKELVALALHAMSERRTRTFVPVNCGAIPEALVEAELFGYRRGAFTDAHSDKPGLFETAHCGTLFLDEIGDLPPTAQVRLLRALEYGEVRRLGETRVNHVDVRVIAATNRPLRNEMTQGRFRSDLFYRLNGASCRIPPLRERPEDIEALIDFWLPSLARQLKSRVRTVTPGALSLLRTHSWPGNVRELRHVLEHAVSLASGDSITEIELASAFGSPGFVALRSSSDGHDQNQGERDLLLSALNEHHWKIGRAAASFGVSRSTFWRKLRRYGIRLRDLER